MGTATGIREIARVIVPVTDVDRAHAFYVDVLGFVPVADVAFDGGRWVEVRPPGGSTGVAFAPPGRGAVGVATGISLRAEDVAAEHARLRALGVDVDELLRPPPPAPVMFFFRDMDGNVLHVAGDAAPGQG